MQMKTSGKSCDEDAEEGDRKVYEEREGGGGERRSEGKRGERVVVKVNDGRCGRWKDGEIGGKRPKEISTAGGENGRAEMGEENRRGTTIGG